MPDARRPLTGSTERQSELKHGRYTAEAIVRRRAISFLIRAARQYKVWGAAQQLRPSRHSYVRGGWQRFAFRRR